MMREAGCDDVESVRVCGVVGWGRLGAQERTALYSAP